MQLTESHGARLSPNLASRSNPQRYADTTLPVASAPRGANASHFHGTLACEAADAMVIEPVARDSIAVGDAIVADAIAPQAVAAHTAANGALDAGARDPIPHTDWTRILYYDVMNANSYVRPQDERTTPGKHRSRRHRSPIVQGAMLLGIYIAMYLLVAAVIHVLPALDGRPRPPIGPHWAVALPIFTSSISFDS
jgi:hypothetical protein